MRDTEMPYRLEKLPDEPIVIIHLEDPFTVEDAKQSAIDMMAYRSEDYVSFMISNASNITIPFSELVSIMAAVGGEGAGKINDPQIRVLSVGTDKMVKMAAEAYGQEQYGGADVGFFNTVEGALQHARTQLIELNREGKWYTGVYFADNANID